VNPAWLNVDMVEQGAARTSFVALGIARRQEPLVAPPDLDPAPVDGVPRRSGGQLREDLGADPAAGQYDRGDALGRDGVNEPGDEPGGDGLR
jgi:hypothetical protein